MQFSDRHYIRRGILHVFSTGNRTQQWQWHAAVGLSYKQRLYTVHKGLLVDCDSIQKHWYASLPARMWLCISIGKKWLSHTAKTRWLASIVSTSKSHPWNTRQRQVLGMCVRTESDGRQYLQTSPGTGCLCAGWGLVGHSSLSRRTLSLHLNTPVNIHRNIGYRDATPSAPITTQ